MWQATVKVPGDAYKMDFVFSDVPSGEGTYDNRGGLDYHLPVEGSPVSVGCGMWGGMGQAEMGWDGMGQDKLRWELSLRGTGWCCGTICTTLPSQSALIFMVLVLCLDDLSAKSVVGRRVTPGLQLGSG